MGVVDVLVFLLFVMVCVQQLYWSWMTQKLVNKIMAGNYGSYVQTKAYEQSTKKPDALPKEFAVKLEDPGESVDRELEALNRMIRPF